ncbi:uncharacterized protein LOC113512676 [Galleria mellonella]|uniref:Uncharacterized protein LOC113512676 n=1 Tax=Galleria mellonella TaxID=7137 RepID=A0ABM3MDX3_GALME|nr:uncharacterized protein LOC113512676 [Galleria mellonella]XP_052749618.1 uncharacterized protein LOC113512676 [Galleria mellonella]
MASKLRNLFTQVIRKQKFTPSYMAVGRKSTLSTESNVLSSVYDDIPISNDTLCDFVWQRMDRWPDKTATVCSVTGRGYTYAQLHRISMVFGASLRSKLKLREDDKVAIILPNVPEYPCIVMGALQAGCVVSPMNPLYTAEELKRQLELIDCKLVVSSKISYPNIAQALQSLKSKIPVILIDNEGLPEGTIKFADFAEDVNADTNCLKSVKRSPDDVAVIPFSSGTSGFPKGVVLTHRSMVASSVMISSPEIMAIVETTATRQSVFAAVIPFFHIFGFNILMLSQLYLGCKLVTLPHFKPDLFLQTIAKYKSDILFMVPPIAVFLARHPAVTPAHLQSVRSIICGAAPLSPADADAIVAKNNNIYFRQGYGLTETCGSFSVARKTDRNHASVGYVLSNCQAKIADMETHQALGPGKEGELWVRGPNVMSGYYKNEEATKSDFTDDGWYKTGDIAKYDENNYLYVTDRLKELIKVKGYQVPPAELETVIRTHPKVADCAVLGVKDPATGEAPKAFFVPQPGQSLTPEELMAFVNSKVTSYKQIKQAQIVDEIPKNPGGKILKRVLKEKYC